MERLRRVAIVTGGARGIGRAIVAAFAARGIVSVIADIDLDVAEKAAEEIRASGAEAVAIKVDLSSTDQIARLVDETMMRYGRLDILVNNAGILSNTPFDQIS